MPDHTFIKIVLQKLVEKPLNYMVSDVVNSPLVNYFITHVQELGNVIFDIYLIRNTRILDLSAKAKIIFQTVTLYHQL